MRDERMPYGMPGASRRDAVTNTDIRIARSVRAERSMNTRQPMPVRLILNARRSSAEALPDQPHAPYERVGRHCCRWQRPGRCRGTMCAQKFAGATACRRYRDRESGEITTIVLNPSLIPAPLRRTQKLSQRISGSCRACPAPTNAHALFVPRSP
jgi:hypothetical protein